MYVQLGKFMRLFLVEVCIYIVFIFNRNELSGTLCLCNWAVFMRLILVELYIHIYTIQLKSVV